MSDLISRQAAAKAVDWDSEAYSAILNLPAIDQVRHGKWRTEYGRYGRSIYCCSECRNYSSEDFPFCHWCGAKMEGSE